MTSNGSQSEAPHRMLLVTCAKCSFENQCILTDGLAIEACANCGESLFSMIALQGFVYVLWNPAMPQLLKIGFTSRSIEERATELSSSTGVPGRFRTLCGYPSINGILDEKKIHSTLDRHRLQGSEFFTAPLEEVCQTIQSITGFPPICTYSDAIDSFTKDYEAYSEYQRSKRKEEETEIKRKDAFSTGVCARCGVEMRKLKKGGWKCRKCGSIYR